MLTDEPTQSMPEPGGQPPSDGSRTALWVAIGVALGAVVMALVVVVLLLTNDDDTATTGTTDPTTTTGLTTGSTATTASTTSSTATTATTTSTTTESSTTTEPSTTTDSSTTSEPSSTTTGFDQLDTAVWPDPDSSTRFDRPRALARSFAEDFLGIDDPIIGDFLGGDARSGEVEIRSAASNEAVTTVLARLLGPGDDWFVIGAVPAAIALDQPETLDVIADPVVVFGQATLALDGTIAVELRTHSASGPLATDSATAAAGSPVPYRFELAWSSSADWAQLVVLTRADDSGEILSAFVIPVRLGPSS